MHVLLMHATGTVMGHSGHLFSVLLAELGVLVLQMGTLAVQLRRFGSEAPLFRGGMPYSPLTCAGLAARAAR